MYSIPKRFRGRLVLFCIIFLLLVPNLAQAVKIQTGSFDLDIDLTKSWTLKFGAGDPRSLSSLGYPANDISLSQALTVSAKGNITPIFSIDADLSDRKPGYLQSFALRMDTDNWDGLLGDFTAGGEDTLGIYNKKLKGIRLEGNLLDTRVQAIASRIEGISKTKVFYGRSTEDEVTFSLTPTEAPWEKKTYRENIKGLQYYSLNREYVKGFTEPSLSIDTVQDLWSLLENWGLGYLKGQIEKEPSAKLGENKFAVVGEQVGFGNLVLLTPTLELIRSRIRQYITAYNEDEPDREKKYPFNEGTDYEKKFLTRFAGYVSLSISEDQFPLLSYKQERFYYLGHSAVEEESISVEVKLDGDWNPLEDLEDYRYRLYPEPGIIELDFPSSFYTDLKGKAVKVTYRYEVGGNVFMLGFSIAPGSEKVYLNGSLLTRGTDYTIDYETGSLIFFRDIGSDDTIRIDYERARGGLGGFAEYKRNLYGLTIRRSPQEGFDLSYSFFRASDVASFPLPPENRTMPNDHTIVGFEGKVEEGPWSSQFQLVGSLNQFPFDDNERKNAPNQVNDIFVLEYRGSKLVLFAHQNGLTVYDGKDWSTYGTSDGMAGSTVYEVIRAGDQLFFATGSGITVLTLSGESPFDRAVNWKSYYEDGGLPSSEVFSLWSEESKLWAGTSSGLVSVGISSLDQPEAWKIEVQSQLENSQVRHLVKYNQRLWLGTPAGLYVYNPQDEGLKARSEFKDDFIRDLLVGDGDLYTVSPGGVYRVPPGDEASKLLVSGTVTSLGYNLERLWYGTGDGFFALGSSDRIGRGKVTEIAGDGGKLWISSYKPVQQSEGEYRLNLFEFEDGSLTTYTTENTGIKPQDQDLYMDISYRGHLDRGVFFQGSLSRKLDFLPWAARMESDFALRQPSYTPIGKLERQDKMDWGLGLHLAPIKGLSVDIGRSYQFSLAKGPDYSPNIVDRVSASYSPWRFDTELSRKVVSGTKQVLSLSSSVQTHLFRKLINWKFGLKGHNTSREDRPWYQTSFALLNSISIVPAQGLSIKLNYTQPITVVGSPVYTEEFQWEASYSRGFTAFGDYGVKVNLDGNGKYGNPLDLLVPEEQRNKATAKFRFDQIDAGIAKLSPYFNIAWQNQGSSYTLSGKATTHATISEFETRSSLTHKISGRWATQRRETKDTISGSLSLVAPPPFDPELEFSLGRTSLTHPGFQPRDDYSGKLELSNVWNFDKGRKNTTVLGISYSSDEGFSYKFNNNLSWKIIPGFTPSLEFGGSYGTKDNSLEATALTSFSYQFRKHWNISVKAGLNLNDRPGQQLRTGSYGTLGLEASF